MDMTVGILARAYDTMGGALIGTPYFEEGEACGIFPTPSMLRPPPPTVVHTHFGGPQVRGCEGTGCVWGATMEQRRSSTHSAAPYATTHAHTNIRSPHLHTLPSPHTLTHKLWATLLLQLVWQPAQSRGASFSLAPEDFCALFITIAWLEANAWDVELCARHGGSPRPHTYADLERWLCLLLRYNRIPQRVVRGLVEEAKNMVGC